MDREEVIARVLKDLEPIFDEISAVMLYGSWASRDEHEGSDIDICLVAPDSKDKIALQRKAFALIRDEKYDVRIFELLPLYLKAEVMVKGVAVYSKDVYELYEYFYFYRKLWEEQKHRQRLSREEALAMFTKHESKCVFFGKK
jgi:predicted nucleotidyltransferase